MKDLRRRVLVTSTSSSGNVFADLELEDADELLTRAKLGYSVRMIIEERGYDGQKQIADLLGIKQPEVSNLMNGKYHLFSETRLLYFLNKLDRKVTLVITSRRAGESPLEVQIA